MATIDDFLKLDIRVVKIKTAQRIPDSEKLLKLTVDIGNSQTRQILAGIGKNYSPEELIDNEVIAIVNLDTRIMMGEESQGMILATGDDIEKISLLVPERKVEPGSKIR